MLKPCWDSAILMLHENPVIPRNQIRAALSNPQTYLGTMYCLRRSSASGLADQAEMIKIVPSG